MTVPELKEKLYQHQQEARTLKLYQQRIQELDEMAHSLRGAPATDSIRIQSSRENRIETALIKLEEARENAAAYILTHEEHAQRITKMITLLPNITEREILAAHTLDGLTMDAIARTMDFSRRHIIRLYGQGLQHLAKILTEQEDKNMQSRNDEGRFHDANYIASLEAYKREEQTKQRYKQVFGMSEKYAEMAKNAELSGDNELLKRVFKLHNAEKPAPAAVAEPDPAEDAFIQGWNAGGNNPAQGQQARQTDINPNDPFVKGWERGAV